MDSSRYFDNAATTPTDPDVVRAMLPYLQESPGNAHSIHSWGTQARDAVERAREQVAALAGAEDPSEIVFTSGATESNNLVLRSYYDVAIGPVEHSSVFETAQSLGHEVLRWSAQGLAEPAKPFGLVSLMAVNNETGQVFDPSWAAPHAACLHSDITQALGKLPIRLAEGPVSLASFSAHKLYGPKGVGGLYVRSGAHLVPQLLGGGQEQGRRSGTLNVPGIVGFGEACRIAAMRQEEDFQHVLSLRNAVLTELDGMVEVQINGGPNVSPFILSLSFRGIEGEALVLEADRSGFAISAGAACSSGDSHSNRVLSEMGIDPEWSRGTVRISFGRNNTLDAAAALGRNLGTSLGTLRAIKV